MVFECLFLDRSGSDVLRRSEQASGACESISTVLLCYDRL